MKFGIAIAALWVGSGALAQPPFQTYGQIVEERASTRLGYWRTDRNAGIGEVVVSYGRPPWKAEYDTQLDALTRGKMWRMGDNYWTLLDTNLGIRLGGVNVAVGLYYLAVRRSEDGAVWELVFIDPEKSRAKGLDAYDVGTRPGEIPVLFSAPLTFEKRDEIVEKVTILLTFDEGSRTSGTFRLTWGNFGLTAPVEVVLPQ
jgi:hypothetical protein